MLSHSGDLMKLHPQSATKILLNCVSPAPAYLSQVCHPDLTKDHLENFDKQLWHIWMRILGGTGTEADQLSFCAEGQKRAQAFAQLPVKLGGAALRSWSTVADYAWYCSFANCFLERDSDFDNGRAFLKEQCEKAHKLALDDRRRHGVSSTRRARRAVEL